MIYLGQFKVLHRPRASGSGNKLKQIFSLTSIVPGDNSILISRKPMFRSNLYLNILTFFLLVIIFFYSQWMLKQVNG